LSYLIQYVYNTESNNEKGKNAYPNKKEQRIYFVFLFHVFCKTSF